MVRIASLEISARRRATAIIIDNHRVFLIRIEMGREVVAAANRVATGVYEIPSSCLSKSDIGHLLGIQVAHEAGFLRLGIEGVEALGVGGTLAIADHHRSGCGQRERLHDVLADGDRFDAETLAIHAIEADAVSILSGEIDVSIRFVPHSLGDVGIEVACDRRDLLVGEAHHVELMVVHAGCLALLDLLTDAS